MTSNNPIFSVFLGVCWLAFAITGLAKPRLDYHVAFFISAFFLFIERLLDVIRPRVSIRIVQEVDKDV